MDATSATANPRELERLRLDQELVDVQTAAGELALATLPLQQEEAELNSKHDERLLKAGRKKLEALSRRLAALREARSRSRLEVLHMERAQAKDPVDTALLDLRLL